MKKNVFFSSVVFLLLHSTTTTACTDDDVACQRAQAEKFAPLLRFDQKQGETNKCFPGNAETYYNAWIVNGNTDRICNTDYDSIKNGTVPIYYQYSQCDSGNQYIRYWFFYDYQDECTLFFGAHDSDWERITVKINSNGTLERVMYFQHSGWYTKEVTNIEIVENTHPAVYIGKNSHGSYHDAGGIGGCGYFDDFRNPGEKDQRMATWQNLIPLDKTPEWMQYNGGWSMDDIRGPLFRNEPDLCAYPVCEGSCLSVDTRGCCRSDVEDGFM